MKKLLLILAFMVCCQPLLSQQTGSFHIQVINDSITSNIYMYVPEDYDSTKTYPMLWGWHGSGMAGENMVKFLRRMQNEIQGIIVCPDANNVTNKDQLNFLIDYSYSYPRQVYRIDTTKIVLTGYSWGGELSYKIGLNKPHLAKGIIGIAPVIGHDQITDNMWGNINKIRMATILGTDDVSYTYIRSVMAEIKERGGSLLYIEKQGLDHEGSNGYYQSQEFVTDYMNCYNYVLNLSTDVEDGLAYRDAKSLAVYPNPASDYISISTNINDESVGEIKIYNTFGSCVMNLKQAVRLVDISMLEPGIYSLVVHNGSCTKTNKFVVLR